MKQFSVKETRKDSKGHKTTITINTEDVKLMKELLLDDNKQTRTSGSKAKPGKKNGPKELPKPTKPKAKPRSNKKKK